MEWTPSDLPQRRASISVVQLHGAAWTSKDHFYSAFLDAVGAPEWHGHNLDALCDNFRGGIGCAVEPPFELWVSGKVAMDPLVLEFMQKVEEMIREAQEETGVTFHWGVRGGQ
eukprot:EC689528.1.p2 GENE.EC689528.1~~EC689528.1.p2  ORF type:complete len:113 (+),score=22.38 EC689528.1:99-437(+)